MPDDQCTETWLPMPEQETRYSISDQGRIRRELNNQGGKAGRILRPSCQSMGYEVFQVYEGRNRVASPLVHRLVLAAFIGPCPPNQNVNHKNGVKDDNRLENLEYTTHLGNMLHARDILKKLSWKLDAGKAIAIRFLYRHRYTQRAIANLFGVSQVAICKVVTNRAWAEDESNTTT